MSGKLKLGFLTGTCPGDQYTPVLDYLVGVGKNQCRGHLTLALISLARPPHINFLIQEEQYVSYRQKNGHLILVNCLRETCPGKV